MTGFTVVSEPKRRVAAPLLSDRGSGTTMRWVMAVMLFLTVLAAALGLGTAATARALGQQLAGGLTVSLLQADDGVAQALAGRIAAMPGVRTVRAVPRAELAELTRPWLGDAGLDPDLPVPALIDVELADAGDAAAIAATDRIRAAAPGARVDRNAAWLAPVRRFVLQLAWFAGALVLLMAGATALIVLLAARAGLDTHRETIAVLHMLGSTDVQVARLFQRRIALDTLIGGAIGTGAALAAVLLLGARVASLDAALLAGTRFGTGDWLALAALPLVFVGVAVVAARVAVLRTLEQVL